MLRTVGPAGRLLSGEARYAASQGRNASLELNSPKCKTRPVNGFFNTPSSLAGMR